MSASPLVGSPFELLFKNQDSPSPTPSPTPTFRRTLEYLRDEAKSDLVSVIQDCSLDAMAKLGEFDNLLDNGMLSFAANQEGGDECGQIISELQTSDLPPALRDIFIAKLQTYKQEGEEFLADCRKFYQQ